MHIVKLASNENPLGPSPLAVQAARAVLGDSQLYPDGAGFELKTALAANLSRQAPISIDQITLGNGSNDVLEMIARAFLTPETSAVFSRHAFAIYPIVCQAVGAKSKVAPCGADYGHDLAEMAALIDGSVRVIFIANPNNPTGTWLTRAALRAFLEKVPENVIVVVDEAYFEYVKEAEYPDSMAWLNDFANLIVTRTFSKAYGLAGLRVGYAVASVAVADLLNRVRQPFNVNSLGLAAAVAALDDSDHLNQTVETNLKGLAQLMEAFDARGLAYIPSVGNFIALDLGRPAMPVYEALLREGVIVRPVANYGMPNHLRVTVGLMLENQFFLDALDRVLSV